MATLYLIPNLLGVSVPESVLPNATIERARSLRHFAVETPKAARAFLSTLTMPVPISSLSMCEVPSAQIAIGWLKTGADVGVLSDAGCPGTADPGGVLVALAHQNGFRVVPMIGPSAILLGLMASGMNGQAFRFHGYLPTDATARGKALAAIVANVASEGVSHIFIETPYRNAAIIKAVTQEVRGNIAFCVAQNLSCEDERIVSKVVSQWTPSDVTAFSEKKPALFLLGKLQA